MNTDRNRRPDPARPESPERSRYPAQGFRRHSGEPHARDPAEGARARSGIRQGRLRCAVFDHEEKNPGDPAKTYKFNSFDMFRIEGGKIKEHWDGAMKNPLSAGKKQ